MATRNFLYLALLLSFLGGCSSVERRHPSKPTVYSENSQDKKVTTTAAPEPANSAPIQVPMSPGNVLPVGVYLGPGLMRSFMHVGVLKALTQAQIPIVSIGGEEWGAVVAGLYSFSKSANDVEWQMLKLRKDQVPAGGFLHSDVETKDSSSLAQFLKLVFGDKKFSTAKIPFGCSAAQGMQIQYLRSGGAVDDIMKCASLPPFYKPYQGKWISGAVAAQAEWLDPMLKDGAKFIIYVDVLGDGPLLIKNRVSHGDEGLTILTAVKSANQWQFQRANMVLKIPATEDILDFDSRRDLVKAGERFATSLLPELMKQIGMNK